MIPFAAHYLAPSGERIPISGSVDENDASDIVWDEPPADLDAAEEAVAERMEELVETAQRVDEEMRVIGLI